MKIKPSDICYYCGNQASTIEHVPPKSFFPAILRKPRSIILVPSCEEHNNNLTHLDDKMRIILTSVVGNNDIGKSMYFSKANKSLIHPGNIDIKKEIYTNSTPIESEDSLKNTIYSLNKKEVYHFITKIAKGVYYSEKKEVWNEKLIIANSFKVPNIKVDEVSSIMNKYTSNLIKELDDSEFKGNIQSVFQYWLLNKESKNDLILMIRFYEKIIFTIMSQNKFEEIKAFQNR